MALVLQPSQATTVFINALDIFGDFGVVLIEEAGLFGTPNFDITPMQWIFHQGHNEQLFNTYLIEGFNLQDLS